ncbi:MAG TPA: hypothetical protein VIM37_01150 [Candidatus Microsaccharimonas sp.]
MRHLVVAVSPDSSFELPVPFADTIVLNKEALSTNVPLYDTMLCQA